MKIILNPMSFFREKSNEKFNIKIPFIIIFSISAISFGIGYILMEKMLIDTPNDIKRFIVLGSIFSLMIGFLLIFFMWFLKASSFHITSILLKGQGDFRKLFELIGYAQFPLIFSSIFVLIIIFLYTPPINIMSITNPQIVKDILNNELGFKLAKIVGRFAFLYSIFLSAIAVREVYSISNKKAAASVIIPILLYLIISEGLKLWIGV